MRPARRLTRYVLMLAISTPLLPGTPGAAGASAQEVLVPGTPVEGALAPGDSVDVNGYMVDVYRVQADPGTRLRISLESVDFDAFLDFGVMVDGGVRVLDSNDDAPGLGSATDAQIVASILEAGEYVVIVSALDTASAGDYRLTAGTVPPGAEVPVGLSMGRVVNGALDDLDPRLPDDTHYDVYWFQGKAGERIMILLEAAFDAYLLAGPVREGDRNLGEYLQDDDGAGMTDSFVEYVVEEAGRHEILVTSLNPATGRYRLRVWTAPPMPR